MSEESLFNAKWENVQLYQVSLISYLKMKTRYIFDTISEDMTPRYILDNKNNP
jgi:hypothetical protein